ncbi:MAG: hypothetical protein ACTSPI_11140 [Candidatus Heimdallarchaeaceae archaeon]
MKKGVKPEKNFHIYGRSGGSGKTQIIYSLIKKCKELNLPFIYRTEFWKGPSGQYIDEDYNPANHPTKVAEWVLKKLGAQEKLGVIFLDEVDIDLDAFRENLKERFGKTNLSFLIVSAAKELPDFLDESFVIFDIINGIPFTENQYAELLDELLERSNINEQIFPKESKDIIIKDTKLWNHVVTKKTPTAVILAASLSLIESIKLAEVSKKPIKVMQEIARKWAILSTSPWFQKYAKVHDVHAEFLIFDGIKYVEIDPHYRYSIP